MSDASKYLPAPYSDRDILSLLRSLSIEPPVSIKPLKVTAAFHIIYVLTFNIETIVPKLPLDLQNDLNPNSLTIELILRISGDHLPRVKTENEAAVLSWVQANTKIPVPTIVSYDATNSNPLQREYILFTRCPGVTISDIYSSLTASQLDSIMNQLIDYLLELRSHPFDSIGGLAFAADSKSIIPGPVVDEDFWFLPDLDKYFIDQGETATLSNINVVGPFDSYTSFVAGSMKSHIKVAQIHSSLVFLQPYIPRLESFITNVLPAQATILNDTRIRLAHRDLHFANILYSPDTEKITAILDWEFACTVPGPRWDPPRAFLWNGQPGEEAYNEKYRLRDRYKELCIQRNAQVLLTDAEFTSELQETMHTVMNYLRCIVTTVPKGEALQHTESWLKILDDALRSFGV